MVQKLIVIEPELHKQIKIISAERGMSIKEFIEKAVDLLFQKYHIQIKK